MRIRKVVAYSNQVATVFTPLTTPAVHPCTHPINLKYNKINKLNPKEQGLFWIKNSIKLIYECHMHPRQFSIIILLISQAIKINKIN